MADLAAGIEKDADLRACPGAHENVNAAGASGICARVHKNLVDGVPELKNVRPRERRGAHENVRCRLN
jgi:hypothetical protein